MKFFLGKLSKLTLVEIIATSASLLMPLVIWGTTYIWRNESHVQKEELKTEILERVSIIVKSASDSTKVYIENKFNIEHKIDARRDSINLYQFKQLQNTDKEKYYLEQMYKFLGTYNAMKVDKKKHIMSGITQPRTQTQLLEPEEACIEATLTQSYIIK